MGIFSSDYQNKMFEPFLQEFVRHPLQNPFQTYYEAGTEINFPYPPVMLLIMSVSEELCLLLPGLPVFLHNILFKLPLLVMDCIVFRKLCLSFPEKRIAVVLVYFASPVILYATYMHSQLDIVPMTFLFLSLLYLASAQTKRNFLLSAVFLSLSLLSKLHILAIVPMIAIYILKRKSLSSAASYCIAVIGMTVAGILPFYGHGFIHGVFMNSAQSALFGLYFSYGRLNLYISLTAVVLIYFYALNLNFINTELLFGLGGLIFSVFLALCAPMPGWYMWVMLFLAHFVLSSNGYHHSLFCYVVLELLYLVFFIFFHQADNHAVDLYCFDTDCSFLKVQNQPVIMNVCFTLLSSTMLYMIYLQQRFCIGENGMYHFHHAAFVIGICGDSGTGKSTLQNSISQLFGQGEFLRIEGDGDHKWERGDSNWAHYTHLNPQANYLYRQARDIQQLKRGQTVRRVDYDHNTGHFTQKMTVRPCRFLSISGLHVFYLPQLRNIIDLKIYTSADEDLRILWKMERDASKRGHTREEVMQQIQSRYPDAQKYIYPQKEFADICLRYFLDQEEMLGIEMQVTTQLDIEPVITAMQQAGIRLSYYFSEDFRYQVIRFCPSENPDLELQVFSDIFTKLFVCGYDILSEPFMVRDTADGVLKLILIQAVHFKLRSGSV